MTHLRTYRQQDLSSPCSRSRNPSALTCCVRCCSIYTHNHDNSFPHGIHGLLSAPVFYISDGTLPSWQVYVPDIKQASIHVVVEGLSLHISSSLCQVDLMDGLSLLYQRHQDCIKPGKLLLLQVIPPGTLISFRRLSLGLPTHRTRPLVSVQFSLHCIQAACIWRFKTVLYFLFKVLSIGCI